mmetsp:Transcript_38953/g.125104  ORF Transcript_38953/g.125104 Transcript_38953/m.125104 type:complete len:239 (-) Transcript_38953:6-722(-)
MLRLASFSKRRTPLELIGASPLRNAVRAAHVPVWNKSTIWPARNLPMYGSFSSKATAPARPLRPISSPSDHSSPHTTAAARAYSSASLLHRWNSRSAWSSPWQAISYLSSSRSASTISGWRPTSGNRRVSARKTCDVEYPRCTAAAGVEVVAREPPPLPGSLGRFATHVTFHPSSESYSPVATRLLSRTDFLTPLFSLTWHRSPGKRTVASHPFILRPSSETRPKIRTASPTRSAITC